MISIILLILKIIGSILLLLLGLILLVILIVLLVPIRYRLAVEHGDEAFLLQGRVHWLLHILHAKVTHQEGVLHIKVRVFGFVIYDNLNPRKPKTKKKKRKSRTRSSQGDERKLPAERKNEAMLRRQEAVKVKKAAVRQKDLDKQIELEMAQNKEVPQKPEVLQKSEVPQRLKEKEYEQKDIIRIVKTQDSSLEQGDDLPEGLRKYAIYEAPEEEESVLEPEVQSTLPILSESKVQTVIPDKVMDTDNTKPEEHIPFLQKILQRVKSIKEKITSSFLGLKSKFLKAIESISNIKHKIGQISDFIKDEINREGFSITYISFKKLIKHILPQKLKSRIVFGTGDPCSTGQVLGVLGILYSFYGDKIQIIPDFENSRFEGKHTARGRIRLVTILIIVIKLILDKRFKQLKSNFQILKEAL